MNSSHTSPLNGAVLQVGLNFWDPYVLPTTNGDYMGYCVDLLDLLAESLHFSYRIVWPPDGGWGVVDDGNWSGLVGQIQRQEVDMAFLLAPSVERGRVADWSVPFDFWHYGVAVRRDAVQGDLTTAFLWPFHWVVYICILAAFSLSAAALLFLSQNETALTAEPAQHNWSRLDIVQYLYGSILNRVVPVQQTRGATAAFVAAWCLLGVFMTSAFTSKLTSLLVDVSSPPVKSLAELVARNDFRYGAAGGTKLLDILKSSRDKTHQAVYKGLMNFSENDPQVLSLDNNLQLARVLSEKYAYIGEGSLIELWAAKHCEISILSAQIAGLEYYSIFFQKNAALKRYIDALLLRLQDTGLLNHLHRKWFPSKTNCKETRHSPRSISLESRHSPRSISLEMLQGPFYIAAGGLLLAAAVVVMERLRIRPPTRV